jgi:hypothetical protein
MAIRGEFPPQLRDEEQIRSDFSRLPHEISMLAALLTDDQKDLRCRLQANMALLAQKSHDPVDQERIVQSFYDTEAQREDVLTAHHSQVPYDTGTLELLTTGADNTLRSLLGEAYIASSDEEHLRLVGYVQDGRVVATEVVYADNFFFKPPNEVLVTGDIFPEEGQTLEKERWDSLIAKNASVFDPLGMNVYSGDLEMDDIGELFGTYYVLDEHSTFETVPPYARALNTAAPGDTALSPRDDFKILAKIPMLETSYMRVAAIGAIVGGKYIPNPIDPEES